MATGCWYGRGCWPPTPAPSRCVSSCAGWATTPAAGTSAAIAGRPRRCWPGCRERSLITSSGPAARCRSWAGAWAASTPGKWPASIRRLVRQVITLGSPFAPDRPEAEPRRSSLPATQPPARARGPGAQPGAASPSPSTCRRRRCTPAGTASCPGGPASSRRPRCIRTSRCAAATSVSASTRPRCG